MKQIPLTRGQFAIVDDIDFSRVSIFKWYATKTGRHYYAKRSSSRATGHNIVSLHRFILDAPKGLIVDHIDGDGLNCQRSNLRMCTVAQNIQHRVVLNRNNTSGVRGVSWDRRRNKWAANINVSGKHKFLGYFTSLEIAATTVHTAILIHHGEYASERDLK